GPYTDPPQARSLRSQRSVDYIVATSAGLHELLRPPNGHADLASRVHSALQSRRTNTMSVQKGSGAQDVPAASTFHSAPVNRFLAQLHFEQGQGSRPGLQLARRAV